MATLAIPGYENLELLGKGGMGEVYRARHDDRTVALKVMADSQAGQLERLRFQREFNVARDLQHPGLVSVFEQGEHDGQLFYTMEVVSGRPFLDHLREHPHALQDLFAQLLEALDYIHSRGIIHRDLKSENVLVEEGRRVRLLDFGLARSADNRITQTGSVLGTPLYMSPEQVLGQELDARTDLYSAGVILYEALAGHPPFEAPALGPLVLKVLNAQPPPLPQQTPLSHLVMRLLHKDRTQRPPSARAVLDELRGVPARSAPGGPVALLAPAFVGREAGLAAASRAQGFVLVTGPSGAGRTRFLQEVDRTAQMQGRRTAWVTCEELDTLPYRAWLPLARLACAEGLPAELETFRGSLALLVPDLGPPEDRGRLHLFEGLARLLDRWDTLLLLDDLDRADPNSLEFLAYLRRSTGVTVVAAGQEGSLEALARRADVHVTLEALATAEVGQVVASMLGGGSLEPAWLQALVSCSGGNPLFLVELVKLLAGTGRLRRDSGEWRSDEKGAVTWPASIQEAVRRRLEGAGPDVEQVAELMALAGCAAYPELAGICGRPTTELLEQLEELRRRRLVEERDGHYKMTQGVLRAVLRDRIPSGRARHWNERLAEVFAAENPERSAGHWEAAGQPGRAADDLVRAARKRLAAHAYVCAAHLLERALALNPALPVSELLADAWLGSNRASRALEVYTVAVSQATTAAHRVRLRRKAGLAWYHRGELKASREQLLQALKEYGIALPSQSWKASWGARWRLLLRQQGRAGSFCSPPDLADELEPLLDSLGRILYWERPAGWLLDTLELGHYFSSHRACGVGAEGLAQLSWGIFQLSNQKGEAKARETLRRGTELITRVEDSPFKVAVTRDLGFLRYLAGDAEGREVVRQAVEVGRRLGEAQHLPVCLGLLGMMEALHGHLRSSGELAAELQLLLELSENPLDQFIFHVLCGYHHAVARESAEARDHTTRAQELRDRCQSNLGLYLLTKAEGWTLAAEDRWEEALAHARQSLALPWAKEPINRVGTIQASLLELTALVELGSKEAPAACTRLLSRTQAYPVFQAACFRLEARVRPPRATELHRRIVELSEGRLPLEERLALHALAELEPERAAEHRERAARLAEETGPARYEALQRTMASW